MIGSGPAQIADAPAGHRIRLRQAVDHDGPLPGVGGDGGRRDVPPAVVDQRLINLVAEHEVIPEFVRREIHDVDQLLAGQDRADRVPGRVEQDDVPVGDPAGLELIAPQGESSIADLGRDGRRLAAPELDRPGIGVVDGIGQQDVVVSRHERAQGGMETQRGAVGDEDLAIGVIREPLLAPQLLGDGPAERRLAAVVGITGAAVAHRADRRLDDVRWRRRIGLAPHQRDQRTPLGLQLPHGLQRPVHGRRPQPGYAIVDQDIRHRRVPLHSGRTRSHPIPCQSTISGTPDSTPAHPPRTSTAPRPAPG